MARSTPEGLAASLQRFGIERDRMRTALARHLGMSESDLDALEHLEIDGPLTQRDLGERLCLTSGAVTMLVDRLERVGLARRQPHPTDRRYTLIGLTAKAETDTPDALARYHVSIKKLSETVPDRHRQVVHGFLQAAAQSASIAAIDLAQ